MEYAAIALPVIQGVAAISGGITQRRLAETQAANDVTLAQLRAASELQLAGLEAESTRIQATQARISHERTAADVLRRINATQAAIRARAAAGGVRAFEGSAEAVAAETGFLGGKEFDVAKENARLAETFGFLQADLTQAGAGAQAALDVGAATAGADITRAAGKAAERSGFLQGLGFFAEAGYRRYKLKEPGGTVKSTKPSLIGDFPLNPYSYG